MKGGYFMVDCGGLDLLSQTSQEIAGLYKQCADAFNSGKPIQAYNCVYGSGVECTPIEVFGIKEAGIYILTASILQVRVAEDDSVTITSLLI